MNVLDDRAVFRFTRAFISMNFEYDSRFGVRLPIWSSPSSLALAGISYDNFISGLKVLRSPKFVCQIRSFGTGVL